MAYLRNIWYVAAWSHEIQDIPLGRKILGEGVVLYRDVDGSVIAGNDLCPHRFAPLHRGRIIDGNIECPYHGLRFNSQGRCVHNPDGNGRIPVGARLTIYPTTERWGCVWIWMGDAARADVSLIPDYEFLSDPERYRPVTGLLHVRANYRYINDNLIDIAHVRMVHSTSLYCETISKARTVVVERPDGLWANRLGQNGAPPPIFAMMWRAARGECAHPMDHWAEVRWNAPSLVMNNTGITVHGQSRESGLETKNSHFLTPETENTTHYFWSICRDFDLDNLKLDAAIREGTENAFVNEDEVMLHALQEAVGDREFWSMQPALMHSDGGAVRLRRKLDQMIAMEQQQTQMNQGSDAKALP